MARKIFPYGRFLGLDSITSPENMNDRYLTKLENAYVDFKGQIVKAPGTSVITAAPNGGKVLFVGHFGFGEHVYLYADGANLSAKSSLGAAFANAFTGQNNFIESTAFNSNLVVSVKDQEPLIYDGAAFSKNVNIPKGGSNATVLNRLCVADLTDTTEVKVSKLDDYNVWSAATPTTGADPMTFNIKNQLNNRDRIRGIGNLEGDKLAIFCRNETLIYSANTDIRNWTIVRDFRVPIGTIGRNTIVPVGGDLFFCSQFGAHTLRRAASGLTLETMQLSRIAHNLYQDFVANLAAGREPAAVWNPNLGQYVIFFPLSDGTFQRMVMTYDPSQGRGGFMSWSTGKDALGANFGSYFSGELIYASDTGVRNGAVSGAAVDMLARSPVLWQGAPHREKVYKKLYVRAVGTAPFTCKIYDEEDVLLQTTEHTPVPTPKYPIPIPCEHKTFGLTIEFICTGAGTLRLLDFALECEV